MSFSPLLAAYGVASSAAGPFAAALLSARVRDGKEDPARVSERFARYTQPRPPGRLIWLHAASVGESNVALSLIEAMAARDTELSFLLSTGTRTSADLAVRRAAPRTTHVYAPLDQPHVVRRFLEYWQPDAGAFVESELWPNLILAAQRAGVPLALVNARMSPRSIARWLGWRKAGERLTRSFRWVSAADTRTAEALSALRGMQVEAPGNLKLAAKPPAADPSAAEALCSEISTRRVWLAASTHGGEDEIALAAHARLREQHPDALLIIAPRHPERGDAIARMADNAPRRSRFESIGKAHIYVADTLGELGLFYQLAPVALVAGSLLPHLKGHNPVEPAKLGAAIVTGPFVESFQDLFSDLLSAGGAREVAHAEALAEAVDALWRDDVTRARQLEAARSVVARGDDAFEQTVTQLLAMIPQPAHAASPANASA